MERDLKTKGTTNDAWDWWKGHLKSCPDFPKYVPPKEVVDALDKSKSTKRIFDVEDFEE